MLHKMANQEIEIQRPNTFISLLILAGLEPSQYTLLLKNCSFSFSFVVFQQGQPVVEPSSLITVGDSGWSLDPSLTNPSSSLRCFKLYIRRQEEQFLSIIATLKSEPWAQLVVIFLPCGESWTRRKQPLCRRSVDEEWKEKILETCKCLCHCP